MTFTELAQQISDERLGQIIKQGSSFVPDGPWEFGVQRAWATLQSQAEKYKSITAAKKNPTIIITDDIVPTYSITPVIKPIADPLKRRDLFVKFTDIYIQDTFYNKSNGKIAGFRRRINEAISDARQCAESTLDFAIVGAASNNLPTIFIHIDCPDNIVYPNAESIIETLRSAVKSGIQIELRNNRTPNSAISAIIQSIAGRER